MPAELALRLLGEPQLTLDGKAIAGLTSPRIYALLAYLIIHRNIPISRQQLSFVLWPDSSEKQARTNLRQLLLKFRLALPNLDKIIVDDGKQVQWRQEANCQVDVVAFQVALAGGQFDEAVELYCGELLAGYTDEWIDSVRTQIESQFTSALRACIKAHESRRDYFSAIRYAERWIQQDHLNEPAYCRLMSLYAQAGDLGSVKRIYQKCLDALAQALNIEPSSETQALFRQLSFGEQTAPFTNQELVNTLLVGREAEWQKLIQTWRHCEVGTARLLAISGEAGIGKTRLAEEFVSWVGQLGITVISARSYLGEDAVPYTPVIACLRSPQLSDRLLKLEDIWLRELARLVPELYTVRPNLSAPGPLKESWQRHRFFEAITRAIVTPEQPLVLWMEDAQWIDPESIAWLRFCLHFVRRAKLLVLCTVRSDELTEDHPFVALQLALRQEGQADELQLVGRRRRDAAK